MIITRDELAKKKGFTSNSYIKALEEGLLPNYDGTRHFQQDNASIHRSAATTEWLLNNAVSVIDWPPHSPDLNPIEHVWAMLKRRLYKMFPYLSNLHANKLDIAEFKECLQKAWQSLDQVKIRNLILSMPRRLAACVAAKGWYTRY